MYCFFTSHCIYSLPTFNKSLQAKDTDQISKASLFHLWNLSSLRSNRVTWYNSINILKGLQFFQKVSVADLACAGEYARCWGLFSCVEGWLQTESSHTVQAGALLDVTGTTDVHWDHAGQREAEDRLQSDYQPRCPDASLYFPLPFQGLTANISEILEPVLLILYDL